MQYQTYTKSSPAKSAFQETVSPKTDVHIKNNKMSKILILTDASEIRHSERHLPPIGLSLFRWQLQVLMVDGAGFFIILELCFWMTLFMLGIQL